VRVPKSITAIRDGRWWRVLSRERGELPASVEEVPF
jgi:hypothetical protein